MIIPPLVFPALTLPPPPPPFGWALSPSHKYNNGIKVADNDNSEVHHCHPLPLFVIFVVKAGTTQVELLILLPQLG